MLLARLACFSSPPTPAILETPQTYYVTKYLASASQDIMLVLTEYLAVGQVGTSVRLNLI